MTKMANFMLCAFATIVKNVFNHSICSTADTDRHILNAVASKSRAALNAVPRTKPPTSVISSA